MSDLLPSTLAIDWPQDARSLAVAAFVRTIARSPRPPDRPAARPPGRPASSGPKSRSTVISMSMAWSPVSNVCAAHADEPDAVDQQRRTMLRDWVGRWSRHRSAAARWHPWRPTSRSSLSATC